MVHIRPRHLTTYTYHRETPGPAEEPGSPAHDSTSVTLPRQVSFAICVLLLVFGFAVVYVNGSNTAISLLRSRLHIGTPRHAPQPVQPAATSNRPHSPASEVLEPPLIGEDGPVPEPNALGHIENQDTRNALAPFISQYGDTLYVYAANLDDNTYAAHQHHVSVPSGSIYKLFIAGEVFRQKTEGRLDMRRSSGVGNWTISQCTRQMVQNSSNACGEALRAELGPDKITASLHEQGYTRTDVAKNPAAETSARDVALLLQRIYRGKYFTDKHTRELDSYLKNQLYRFRIPEGLPRKPAIQGALGTRNKTGDVYGYTNDAAIVYGENTDYILVILSGQWSSPTASSYVHRYISGSMYNFFNDTDYPLPYQQPWQ